MFILALREYISVSMIVLMLIVSLYIFLFPVITKENREINRKVEHFYNENQIDKKPAKFSYFSKVLLMLTFLLLALVILLVS